MSSDQPIPELWQCTNLTLKKSGSRSPQILLDAFLLQIWSGLVESLMIYRANESQSAENRVKTVQMTLKMKVKVAHSQQVLKAMLGVYLVWIWSGLVESLMTSNINWDGQTDGRTPPIAILLRPVSPRGKNTTIRTRTSSPYSRFGYTKERVNAVDMDMAYNKKNHQNGIWLRKHHYQYDIGIGYI